MMCVILMIVGLVAGLLSGSVGFGGGMILLPVITYFYGVEVAVPVSTDHFEGIVNGIVIGNF